MQIAEAIGYQKHRGKSSASSAMALPTMSRVALPAALLVATLSMVASVQVDNPDEVGVPYLYKGLMVWAFFWAFLDAYTIGANDVANAFANAVGAGTLTHRGACLIACIFEFIGVVALGSQVTDTVRSKMLDFSYFKHDPWAGHPVRTFTCCR